MSDVTIDYANIRPLDGCIIRRMTAGEAMAVGQPVYVSANDTVSLTDASDTTKNFCVGVVVAGAEGGTAIASGEEVDVVLYGPVAGYSTNMAAGTVFWTNDSVGVIADAAGTKDTMIGIGLNASVLLVKPQIVDFS